MANIDVSDILDDPDFWDEFEVVRYSETVDSHGRSVDTAAPRITVTGVVQAGSGTTFRLMPDLVRQAGVIEIWTEYNLQGETDTTAPDEVIWGDKHYRVVQTYPWSNWGSGFVHAVCVRREMTGRSTPL